MTDLFAYLKARPYPGRGILLGAASPAEQPCSIAAYFIMGRSENSRNRVFEKTEDGIRTVAKDKSLVTDPSLIIYHPVRLEGTDLIVTNGDQTDTVRDYLREGRSFDAALRTRTFEPDAPNYTPRISGLLHRRGDYALSILKTREGDREVCQRQFFEYDHARLGIGHFISTYEGFGAPIPSFSGEPVAVALPDIGAEELAERIWDSLDEANRVSLYVRYTNLRSGEPETVILNKYGGRS